ncbi:hypothetical protein [Mucilaginibacter sp. dw_454]|uniref:hypothetical protein n=1 Tax=Mucilaginibacter sp. dw_454 TaxID=2720079 RepID=UPI001BD69798|nr:hypothetical protein [Mucilaginibacter sp. dw_454]
MKLSQSTSICFMAFLFLSFNTYAQNIEKLTLNLPTTKVYYSLYNRITLIDARADTVHLGILKTGAFNKTAILVANEPLQQQLNKILKNLTDFTAKQQELVLQLRYICFAEAVGGTSEMGYFMLKAQLYAKVNDGYRKINSIDTIARVSAVIDVSNELLQTGSEILSHFIAVNLKRQPSNYSYGYNDVAKVDSIEKSRLFVYNTNTYADGLYLTYKTFTDQVPDMRITVDGDSLQKNNVKAADETGKLKKVKTGNFFAVVYKGVPYISTFSGYYKLTKKNNDFFFNGKVIDFMHPANNSSGSAASAFMFGAIGGAVAGAINAASSTSNNTEGEFKVNYENGQFIKIR